jgi:hypothetical protein
MPPIENLSNATVNYLYCVAGISFGLGWLSGAYEVFRQISPVAEYKKIFTSIVMIAGINTTASFMPLIFNETDLYLTIPSYWLFCTALPTYALLLHQLLTGQVKLYDRRATPALFVVTAIGILLIPVNAHLFKSIVMYKCFILWATGILSYRFFLFVRVIGVMKTLEATPAIAGEVTVVKVESMDARPPVPGPTSVKSP